MNRLPYLCLAYGCLGLGAAGIFLPLLPTTPFLLVAAWAAARGSPRLEHWLHHHSPFAPILAAWHEQRAVPLRAKWLACLLMAGSWLFMLYMHTPRPVLIVTGLLFTAVGTFLFTRPNPPPAPQAARQ
ncbi:MAG TPA: YbaN family protein [Gammaproteobacteria bacterium]